MRVVALLLALALAIGPQGRREVTVADPLDHATRVYRGAPLLDLLPSEGMGDAVLIRCLDGFVVLVPLALVQRVGPVVADEVKTAEGWRPIPSPRGPRYLVWPNIEHPEIDRDADITGEGWAWGEAPTAVCATVLNSPQTVAGTTGS